ncbi:hypothetical protein EBU95_02325 [bacterium]|nr:hypothetical protein [bacterium]
MYLVLLLTHKQNLKEVLKNKGVWLEKTGTEYLILYGDTQLGDDYHYDATHKVLAVKCPDTYEYLTLKLACAYKFIVTSPYTTDVQGVFKVDDDVFVNVDELRLFIGSGGTKDDYVGHVYKVSDTLCSHHHHKVSDANLNDVVFKFRKCLVCYGPMYYLSRRSLNQIVSKFSYQNFCVYSTQLFEDYTFANILFRSGITPVTTKMYTDNLDEFFKLKFIAFHDADHKHDLKDIVTTPVSIRPITPMLPNTTSIRMCINTTPLLHCNQ